MNPLGSLGRVVSEHEVKNIKSIAIIEIVNNRNNNGNKIAAKY